VIGGGLPIGAVGGRRDVMETLSPLGPVFHAGTLAGNPLATAAGLAALGELTPDAYVELAERARRLAAVLGDACAGAGFAVRFPVVGTLVGVVCGDVPPPVDFDGARRTDEKAYAALFHALLDEGVALAPGAYEAVFPGLAHDDAVIDHVGEAASRAARTAASGG
jgi:glutamate-1-semialdehyde 2,1-aminomutase